ncbi:MAG: sigma-70 family RNA polymerase sigma factor [Candidatus Rokubacteria bacterium]|nr:sigma-70 family RNA polymerase sigma factor [Candidatus Rokubacteria bacterium]
MRAEHSRDALDDLLGALRRGEPEALSALVDRQGPRLYNFATRMCRSAEDAKDVTQETFLAALRSVKDFRGESTVSTWLFRIAANACRKMRRHGKFEPAHHLSLDELMPGEGPIARPAEGPETAVLRADVRTRLEDAIATLPPPYRAVLVLRDLEGLTTAETAGALGITLVTVKVRLHRARLALRRALAPTLGGHGAGVP